MFKRSVTAAAIGLALFASAAVQAESFPPAPAPAGTHLGGCLLYTSDAADD